MTANRADNTGRKPKRRRFRYSLRRLMVRLACVSAATASSFFPRSMHTPVSNHTVCLLPTSFFDVGDGEGPWFRYG